MCLTSVCEKHIFPTITYVFECKDPPPPPLPCARAAIRNQPYFPPAHTVCLCVLYVCAAFFFRRDCQWQICLVCEQTTCNARTISYPHAVSHFYNLNCSHSSGSHFACCFLSMLLLFSSLFLFYKLVVGAAGSIDFISFSVSWTVQQHFSFMAGIRLRMEGIRRRLCGFLNASGTLGLYNTAPKPQAQADHHHTSIDTDTATYITYIISVMHGYLSPAVLL